ncbi:hypothetical protein [Pseudomonas sp. DR48]|uniref:hypothetical protein n=1 Tax=Pseudomonas sp. DR48 TaxID=2871095 RepID=UPI001C9A0772|nr:hypothetical protein [Pseudomonas sp. DR48]QZP30489.1 hypothetical protein K5K95_20070 [Pseudomonas sp. DR48]
MIIPIAAPLYMLWLIATGSYRPILLKKSAVFSKAEKYASEIEILNVRRAFQAEISRRSVLKRRFHPSILRHSEKTDFFNRIGHKETFILRRDATIKTLEQALLALRYMDLTSLEKPLLAVHSRSW